MIKINKPIREDIFNLLYNIFNRLLFRGTLPRVQVKIKDFKDQDYRGVFVHTKSGRPIAIIIDKSDIDPVRILVHEMVHVYLVCVQRQLNSDHPPSFVRKLTQVYRKLGLAKPTRTELDL